MLENKMTTKGVHMNSKVDEILSTRYKKWQKEVEFLRKVCLSTEIHEELKWGSPCYKFNKKNICIISGLKDYFLISFFQGVLLKDPKKILVQQTENVQSARVIKMTTIQEIENLKEDIINLINEAKQVVVNKQKVIFKSTRDFQIPKELQDYFEKDQIFEKAFNNLTPGRQRGYILHIASAKQSKTRISRITKFYSKILEGKGFQE